MHRGGHGAVTVAHSDSGSVLCSADRRGGGGGRRPTVAEVGAEIQNKDLFFFSALKSGIAVVGSKHTQPLGNLVSFERRSFKC